MVNSTTSTISTAGNAPKAAAARAEANVEAGAAATKRVTEAVAAPVREIAEKGVAQAKENYSRFKSAAEEANDAMEDSFATMTKGYKEFGQKSVEVTRANVNAHFDFLASLLSAKSVSQAIELQTSYARRQFDVIGGQTKELSALAQKAATESAKPLKEIATKGVKYAQAS